MKKLLILLSLIYTFTVLADVIYFANGDIDEGYVEIKSNMVVIFNKKRTGKYELPRCKIKYIEYGSWIKDLDSEIKKIANDSKQIKQIEIGGTKAKINKIKKELPEKLNDKVFKNKFMDNEMFNSNKYLAIFFVAVFIILSIIAMICNVLIIMSAFNESILWGLLCIFIPIFTIIFLFTKYPGKKGAILFWLLAPFNWSLLFFLISYLI